MTNLVTSNFQSHPFNFLLCKILNLFNSYRKCFNYLGDLFPLASNAFKLLYCTALLACFYTQCALLFLVFFFVSAFILLLMYICLLDQSLLKNNPKLFMVIFVLLVIGIAMGLCYILKFALTILHMQNYDPDNKAKRQSENSDGDNRGPKKPKGPDGKPGFHKPNDHEGDKDDLPCKCSNGCSRCEYDCDKQWEEGFLCPNHVHEGHEGPCHEILNAFCTCDSCTEKCTPEQLQDKLDGAPAYNKTNAFYHCSSYEDQERILEYMKQKDELLKKHKNKK